MALVHGGGAFNLFSPSVYCFLCGAKVADLIPTIDDVPDPSIRTVLNQVRT